MVIANRGTRTKMSPNPAHSSECFLKHASAQSATSSPDAPSDTPLSSPSLTPAANTSSEDAVPCAQHQPDCSSLPLFRSALPSSLITSPSPSVTSVSNSPASSSPLGTPRQSGSTDEIFRLAAGSLPPHLPVVTSHAPEPPSAAAPASSSVASSSTQRHKAAKAPAAALSDTCQTPSGPPALLLMGPIVSTAAGAAQNVQDLLPLSAASSNSSHLAFLKPVAIPGAAPSSPQGLSATVEEGLALSTPGQVRPAQLTRLAPDDAPVLAVHGDEPSAPGSSVLVAPRPLQSLSAALMDQDACLKSGKGSDGAAGDSGMLCRTARSTGSATVAQHRWMLTFKNAATELAFADSRSRKVSACPEPLLHRPFLCYQSRRKRNFSRPRQMFCVTHCQSWLT